MAEKRKRRHRKRSKLRVPFNWKTFLVILFIWYAVSLVSLIGNIALSENTATGLDLFLDKVHTVFRFPVLTFFGRLLGDLTLPGLFINSLIYGILFERIISYVTAREAKAVIRKKRGLRSVKVSSQEPDSHA
ncbi:hypothetical protein [Hufsiella ginkgonis]|uniref:Uncharacterized protein n=1 Tax=Hufsiella ginkgonis TaxID=2695274 RepID=A0A7K1Y1M1_9SPHI|nr:hypothetical protein [Hufsiella ginkgonis]MXV16919.1 hypothetical protein [Hufsiella ginkgonis]